MGKKLQRRSLRVLRSQISKVRRRKFNPPARGIEVQLQEANRPILDSILSKVLAEQA